MTSKQYLVSVFACVTLVVGSIVSLNFYLNDFGLFGARSDLRIWGLEKTSKYLLSFEYIPNNFEGILIGSSVSANLDTREIEGVKLYNLSMSGSNISELKYPINNVLGHEHIKYMVICLYPYLTKNSGRKGRQIDEKEYWGSLYSTIPFIIMAKRLYFALFPNKDVFHSSEWGYNDENKIKKNVNFQDILNKRRIKENKKIIVDPIAYQELQAVIQSARENNVTILAYYYPAYFEFLKGYENSGAWEMYQGKMNQLFLQEDVVWDMNLAGYEYITHNVKAYSDGHLSNLGASYVVSEISHQLSLLKNKK